MIKTVIQIFRQLGSSFAPKTMILGVVAGFATLCVLGRHVAWEEYHKDFVRFTRWTGPESKYYPTIDEMCGIVRSKIRPGQILVVVGGNSVLRGVGQLPDKIWTKYLQANLGAGYCVVNLAFNASGLTDCAAVAAEVLRQEFPRQIYMANAAPTQWPIPDGTNEYRFVFWEAYHKGLLIDYPERLAVIKSFHDLPPPRYPYGNGMPELHLREQLDRWFYFQNFWNGVTFEKINTVWGAYMPGLTRFLQPRRSYPDPEPDSFTFPIASRYPEANLEVEMVIVRGCSIYAYNKDAAGKWQLYAPIWDLFDLNTKASFPPELLKRTLILMSRNSPYYIRRLPPDEQERNDLTYKYAVKKWQETGCDALDYGGDFTVDDYHDRTHLTWHGGRKLAGLVAGKVRAMSQNLGYLEKNERP